MSILGFKVLGTISVLFSIAMGVGAIISDTKIDDKSNNIAKIIVTILALINLFYVANSLYYFIKL